MTGQVDVDHVVPWARYPDNGIENLVAAHQNCNNQKRDFLAAAAHVERWSVRFREPQGPVGSQLGEIANRAGWDRHPRRTVNVARAIYHGLPDELQLWLRGRDFVEAGGDRPRFLPALASCEPQATFRSP